MGQFSWLDCKTKEQIVDDFTRDVYVLVPDEFGGGHIHESCYDGYGHFGGKDIYELVVDWNRGYIPTAIQHLDADEWVCVNGKEDIDNLMNFYNGADITCEKRWLGIILACYDKDNARLRYPIKITHDPNAKYGECGYSLTDPNQGWVQDDDCDYEY